MDIIKTVRIERTEVYMVPIRCTESDGDDYIKE
jgi:hypothetical protein